MLNPAIQALNEVLEGLRIKYKADVAVVLKDKAAIQKKCKHLKLMHVETCDDEGNFCSTCEFWVPGD